MRECAERRDGGIIARAADLRSLIIQPDLSPSSSMSTSAIDSEADFARLAENLALKSDAKGAFSFDPSTISVASSTRRSSVSSDVDTTPVRPWGAAAQRPLSSKRAAAAAAAAAAAKLRPLSPARPLLELRTAVVPSSDEIIMVLHNNNNNNVNGNGTDDVIEEEDFSVEVVKDFTETSSSEVVRARHLVGIPFLVSLCRPLSIQFSDGKSVERLERLIVLS